MKHVLLLLIATLAFSAPAFAQAAADQNPYAEVHERYAQRDASWWKSMSKQLILNLDGPAQDADPVDLHNIVYFVQYHSDKVDLDAASPKLFAIYQSSPRESVRMMALVALHAIGSERQMEQLYWHNTRESSDRLRHMATAALHDYYSTHERVNVN